MPLFSVTNQVQLFSFVQFAHKNLIMPMVSFCSIGFVDYSTNMMFPYIILLQVCENMNT
jgi:hypothetical protein